MSEPSASLRSERPTDLLLIRAHAARSAGFGHVVRMTALAEAWIRAGGVVEMIVETTSDTDSDAEQDAVRAFVEASGAAVFAVAETNVAGSDADADVVCNRIEETAPGWVVLDGYCFDLDYQDRVQRAGAPVAVVDDHARRGAYRCEVVLDHNPGTDAGAYRGLVGEAKLLAGARYTLLRDQFVLGDATPDRTHDVVVSFGGSRPEGSASATNAIAAAVAPGTVVVVGPVDGQLDAGVEHIEQSLQPAAVYSSARVAVVAAGSTVWELCAVRTPMITVTVADNQAPVAEVLAHSNAALTLGPLSVLSDELLVTRVRDLLRDPDEQDRLTGAAGALVDGFGARRVVAALRSNSVLCRPTQSHDAALLLDWVNDPLVRAGSLTSADVTMAEHEPWLTSQLADDDAFLFVAEIAGSPIGQVRFNRITLGSDGSNLQRLRISISLAAEARGRSLSAPVILAGVDAVAAAVEVDGLVIEAEIKGDNHASRSAFTIAGFVFDSQRQGDDGFVETWVLPADV